MTPPTITSTPVTTATENAPYSYEVQASDLDSGDSLTLSLGVVSQRDVHQLQYRCDHLGRRLAGRSERMQ